MSLAKIEVEQYEPNRWVAEVEVGGMVARRAVIRAASFEEVMIAIEDQYREFMPKPQVVPAAAKKDVDGSANAAAAKKDVISGPGKAE